MSTTATKAENRAAEALQEHPLYAIWHPVKKEKTQSIVVLEVRNVLPQIQNGLEQRMSLDAILRLAEDGRIVAPFSEESHRRFMSNNLSDALAMLNAQCNQRGEMMLNDFIYAFKDNENMDEDSYVEVGEAVATALQITTTDINPDYWSDSYTDGLCAWDAAIGLKH